MLALAAMCRLGQCGWCSGRGCPFRASGQYLSNSVGFRAKALSHSPTLLDTLGVFQGSYYLQDSVSRLKSFSYIATGWMFPKPTGSSISTQAQCSDLLCHQRSFLSGKHHQRTTWRSGSMLGHLRHTIHLANSLSIFLTPLLPPFPQRNVPCEAAWRITSQKPLSSSGTGLHTVGSSQPTSKHSSDQKARAFLAGAGKS